MNSLVGQRLWKWKLVAGLLTIVMGAIVLAWPGPTILVASTLFGVYLLLSGLAELFGACALPGRGWYIAAGIISVLAGLVVLVWPFDSIAVLTLAAGIWLVIIGITQIIQAFQARKAANAARQTVDDVSNRLTTALSD